MNYLQLVNEVLKRMRENQVTSLFENTQSTVVSTFVNDAMRQVQESHDWSTLRQDITIGTATDVTDYALTGTDNRATIKDIRNITDNYFLHEAPSSYIRRQELVDQLGSSSPRYFARNGTDSNGAINVTLWPPPDGAYVIKAHCVVRTADLVAEGDTVDIPDQPIILMAHAMAAAERGDVSAVDVQSLYQLANQSLSRAVQLDAAQNRDELVWAPV